MAETGFCIHVGLLPRFAAWSTVPDKGACSQMTVRGVSLLHLGTESHLGRQSGHGTGREEAPLLLPIHQHQRPVHGVCKWTKELMQQLMWKGAPGAWGHCFGTCCLSAVVLVSSKRWDPAPLE